MTYSQSRMKTEVEDCKRHYSEHVIAERSENSWYIKKPGTSNLATEIVALRHGLLYVGGDVDTVVFGNYYDRPSNFESRVHWLGGKQTFTSYVEEKARIGMGSHDAIYEYDSQKADEDIARIIQEYREMIEDEPDNASEYQEVIDNLEDIYTSDGNAMMLYHAISEAGVSSVYDYNGLGEVVRFCVIRAWAALNRLSTLLAQEPALRAKALQDELAAIRLEKSQLEQGLVGSSPYKNARHHGTYYAKVEASIKARIAWIEARERELTSNGKVVG